MDNLRNLTILLLFPVHTFMIWNNFGQKFYIWQGENKILSTFIVLVNPWFMPLLFILAGMSARYALEKRTVKEFIDERVTKLFIPFISGLILLIPVQTFFARKYFDHFNGTMLENWRYFFSHLTDFSGYDGAFTPGHLWFILYLFLISLLALPVFLALPYQKIAPNVQKLPVTGIFFLFIPIWLMYYLGNFGGYSIGKYFALYIIGYYFLSNENVIAKIEKNIRQFLFLGFTGTLLLVILYYNFSYYGDLWINCIGWNCILCLLILGKKFLNKHTKFTAYGNWISYPVYILHQSILVALAYYILPIFDCIPMQAAVICAGGFLLTVSACHLIRPIPYVRKIIGIR